MGTLLHSVLRPQWVLTVRQGAGKPPVMGQVHLTSGFSVVHRVDPYLSEKKADREQEQQQEKVKKKQKILCVKFDFQCSWVKCYWETGSFTYDLSVVNNVALNSCKRDLMWPRKPTIFAVWSFPEHFLTWARLSCLPWLSYTLEIFLWQFPPFHILF